MKTIKTAVRYVAFLAILAFLSVNVYNVLAWKGTEGIDGLYRLSPDTTDVLFVGSSHCYCTVNTALLWEDHGIAANDISESAQIIPINYYYLKEALKYQHPKVVLVELYGFDRNVHIGSGAHYRNSLNMRWSKNYFDNATFILDNIKAKWTSSNPLSDVRKGIFLKFPAVHSRYGEITEEDFDQAGEKLRHLVGWDSKSFEIPEAINETGVAELTDAQQEYLDGMVALSKEHDFRLVFWVAPYVVKSNRAKQYNAIERYAQEKGVEYYNFLHLIDETGFDFATDLRKDGSHINSLGAQKVTRYLGKVLTENFDVPDRRGDPAYARYEEAAREWDLALAAHGMEIAEDLDSYLAAVDLELMTATAMCYDPQAVPQGEAWKAVFTDETEVPGLYTQGRRDPLNGVWALSDRFTLTVGDGELRDAKLYEGAEAVKISKGDLCVIVLNRDNGRLVDLALFKDSGDGYVKA